MVYITGDTHGDINRFSTRYFYEESTLGKDDVLIVCGDFGFIFENPDSDKYQEEQDTLDKLSKKPYIICFCDGNHENFAELYKYPEVTMFGNTVHKVRDNIFHLERGRVYTIQGEKYFVFGGAATVDVEIMRRKDGVDWWPSYELPNNDEYRRSSDSLNESKFEVDYIITHTMPRMLIDYLRISRIENPADTELTGHFDWILNNTTFKKWYFGHWHFDQDIEFPLYKREEALLCKYIFKRDDIYEPKKCSFKAMFFDYVKAGE